MARIFVGVGKNHGVRPGDLVGAIANETRVDGPDIGKINVAPNFTIVEVPDRNAREVITALRATTIRGETPTVRFDKAGSDEWEDRRGDDSGGRSGGGGYQGRGGVATTGVATVLTAAATRVAAEVATPVVATRAAAAVATPVVATRAAVAVAIVPIVAGTKVATIAAAVYGTPKPFGTGAGVPARPRLSRTSQ